MQIQGEQLSYFERGFIRVPWQETVLLNLHFYIASLSVIALLFATLLRFTNPHSHWFRRSHRASVSCSLLVILLIIAEAGYHILVTCTKVVEAGRVMDSAFVMSGFGEVGVALIWMAGAGAALLLALLLHWSRPELKENDQSAEP